MEGLQFVFSGGATRNSSVSDFFMEPERSDSVRPDPAYFTRRSGVSAFGGVWDELTVALFFTVNPGYRVCGVPVGRHAADVERVVILSDRDTGRPEHVYFGAHGRGQGVWIRWDSCEFAGPGVLRVHVAAGSNAMYPRGGTYPRVLFLANDVCNGRGGSSDYLVGELADAAAQSWSGTYQVAPGINSPLHVPAPSETSVTPLQRLLLPLHSARFRKLPTLT